MKLLAGQPEGRATQTNPPTEIIKNVRYKETTEIRDKFRSVFGSGHVFWSQSVWTM